MQCQVRLNGALARAAGQARLAVTVPDGATVAELIAEVRRRYPAHAQALAVAVAVQGGRHVAGDARLVPGQEVALLLPVAGG